MQFGNQSTNVKLRVSDYELKTVQTIVRSYHKNSTGCGQLSSFNPSYGKDLGDFKGRKSLR